MRAATERALLQLSGEVGYANAGVAAVVARSGSNLARFYRTYTGKAACYAAAYESAAGSLCTRLLDACAEAPDWGAGLKRALLELDSYAREDRALARGVIVEVHAADGAALARREDIVGRLAGAVDKVRAQALREPSPPPRVAYFLIEAIEAAVVRSLAEGGDLREALPGLLFLVVSSYFDPAEAARHVRGWPGQE